VIPKDGMELDTKNERERYDARAKQVLQNELAVNSCGYKGFVQALQKPYVSYYDRISSRVQKSTTVVELGAGDGQHSLHISELSDNFTATDISPVSLELLESRLHKEGARVKTQVADMVELPFEDNSVDVVTSAGSLSYADPTQVDAEILRVLKPEGCFICVDSLNHNPVYKMNRYIHYLRGHRTKATLRRMPNSKRLRALTQHFSEVEIEYFGSISFTVPLLHRLFGNGVATTISGFFDGIPVFNRMAFKFVLCAVKPIKTP